MYCGFVHRRRRKTFVVVSFDRLFPLDRNYFYAEGIAVPRGGVPVRRLSRNGYGDVVDRALREARQQIWRCGR